MLMKVWYSLDARIDAVKVAIDADVSDFRDAIIAKNPPLQSLSPGNIEIFPPPTDAVVEQSARRPIRLDTILSSLVATSFDRPLIVVPPQQPQQVDDFHELVEFARTQRQAATANRDMSKASADFAAELLEGLGITFKFEATCLETGGHGSLSPFPWMMTLDTGEEVERTGTAGTLDFREWLRREWLGKSSSWSIEVVTGEHLPKVKANRKSATGKSDLCVGHKDEMKVLRDQLAACLPAAFGLVEIKRHSSRLNVSQLQLQLVAASRISRFQKGVVLLGTDGNYKWCTVRFSKHNEIALQYYQSGSKCLEEFENLLTNVAGRQEELARAEQEEMSNKRPRFSFTPEDSHRQDGSAQAPMVGQFAAGEQDLSGFDGGDNDMRDKAIEDENYLRRLAEVLGDLAGGSQRRPEIPEWALAKNRIPSYYS